MSDPDDQSVHTLSATPSRRVWALPHIRKRLLQSLDSRGRQVECLYLSKEGFVDAADVIYRKMRYEDWLEVKGSCTSEERLDVYRQGVRKLDIQGCLPLLVEVHGAPDLFETFPNLSQITSQRNPLTRLARTNASSSSTGLIESIIIRATKTILVTPTGTTPTLAGDPERYDLPSAWHIHTRYDLKLSPSSTDNRRPNTPPWLCPSRETLDESEYALPPFLTHDIHRLTIELSLYGTRLTDILRKRQFMGYAPIPELVLRGYQQDLTELVQIRDHLGDDLQVLLMHSTGASLDMQLKSALCEFDWSGFKKLRVLRLELWAAWAEFSADEQDVVDSFSRNPLYPFISTAYISETIPSIPTLERMDVYLGTPDSDVEGGTSREEPAEVLPSHWEFANCLLRIGGPECVYNVVILVGAEYEERFKALREYVRIGIKKEITSILRREHGMALARRMGPTCDHPEGH